MNHYGKIEQTVDLFERNKSMKDIEDRALDSTSSGAVNLKCAESDDDYMKFQEEVWYVGWS